MSSKTKKPRPQIVTDTPAEAPSERVEISPKQAEMLAQAAAALNNAQAQLSLIFTSIMAGHALDNVRLADLARDGEKFYAVIQRL